MRVGKCLAAIERRGPNKGKPCLLRRPGVNYKGEEWLGARLSFCLNVKRIPRKPKGGGAAKKGLCCHSCNNKWCVDFNHIYLGTKSENVTDFYQTDRGAERKLEISNLHKGTKMTEVARKNMKAGHARLKRNKKRFKRYQKILSDKMKRRWEEERAI
jgi:hypothetical protein